MQATDTSLAMKVKIKESRRSVHPQLDRVAHALSLPSTTSVVCASTQKKC